MRLVRVRVRVRVRARVRVGVGEADRVDDVAALEELDDLVGRHVGAVVLGLSGRRTQVRDADELGVVLVRVRVGVRVRVRVRARVRVTPTAARELAVARPKY